MAWLVYSWYDSVTCHMTPFCVNWLIYVWRDSFGTWRDVIDLQRIRRRQSNLLVKPIEPHRRYHDWLHHRDRDSLHETWLTWHEMSLITRDMIHSYVTWLFYVGHVTHDTVEQINIHTCIDMYMTHNWFICDTIRNTWHICTWHICTWHICMTSLAREDVADDSTATHVHLYIHTHVTHD